MLWKIIMDYFYNLGKEREYISMTNSRVTKVFFLDKTDQSWMNYNLKRGASFLTMLTCWQSPWNDYFWQTPLVQFKLMVL